MNKLQLPTPKIPFPGSRSIFISWAELERFLARYAEANKPRGSKVKKVYLLGQSYVAANIQITGKGLVGDQEIRLDSDQINGLLSAALKEMGFEAETIRIYSEEGKEAGLVAVVETASGEKS